MEETAALSSSSRSASPAVAIAAPQVMAILLPKHRTAGPKVRLARRAFG